MIDWDGCPKCGADAMAEWPEEGFWYCRNCGWREGDSEAAAEQRNEAISDGQKCFFCGGSGNVPFIFGSIIDCPYCKGQKHF